MGGVLAPHRAFDGRPHEAVIINFESEGGFAHLPGLSRPLRIDTAELSPDQATQLEGLVGRAHFFDQPPEVGGPAPGAADLRSYTITVADGGRTHTVRTSDALSDPALRDLVERLRTHPRAQP